MSWTFPYLGETEKLNDDARDCASGSFIRLSDGYTHYEVGGVHDGNPVVLVHGFSVPYFIWDPTFRFLTDSGFRALRYDLYGRGYSDRPHVRYNIECFCRQLSELLEALGFDSIRLIGLSMGGLITAWFTVHYPNKVEKLVLIDPAGVRPVTLARILKGAATPGFGELAFGLFGTKNMTGRLKNDFYDPKHVKAFVKQYMVQMKYKGFMRAILSTVRNGMLGDYSHTFQKLGELSTPTMLLWGREDKTVPLSHSDDLLAAIPEIEFHVFDNCGHLPHYEKPEKVNPLLKNFLQ